MSASEQQLKRMLSAIKDGTHGTFARANEGRPLLSAKNVQDGRLTYDDTDSRISEEDYRAITANGFPRKDDVLLTIVGSIGRACVFPEKEPIAFQRSVAFLRPSEATDARYLGYVLQAEEVQEQLRLATKISAQGGVYLGDVSSLRCRAVESKQTQERIANFLDEKTARIDALIAEKERLITLLDRSAADLIQHAVTKGTRGAKLASSGRAWIGDMPAHWSAPFIRFVARLESGHTPSRQHPEWWEKCSIPWFSLADVWQIRDGQREVVTETAELISELGLLNSSARLLPAGTVMVSRTASVGFSAIMGVPMATTQDFANWVCGPKILPEFLLYVFRAMGPEFERLKFGSTHSTIYMPDIATFTTPLPPLEEQREIVALARSRKARFDELRKTAVSAVERLREYRSSLISVAVTGQMTDVAFDANELEVR